MSDSVIGSNTTKLWSLTGPLNASQTTQATETSAAPTTPSAPTAPSGDSGAFNGASALQAAATTQWSAADVLGSSPTTGGTWSLGWENNSGSGVPTSSQWSNDLVTVGNNQWTVDPLLANALKGLEGSVQALEDARAAALKEIAAIRDLVAKLEFAQGGAVDSLKVGRKERFENELKAAEQALLKNPPDIEAYRRDLNDARTILNPPYTPLNEQGQSRNQLHWGVPVPGSQAALAKLNALIDGAGTATSKVSPTLYSLRGDMIKAQATVDTLKNAAEQRAKIQAKTVEFNQATVAATAAQANYKQAVAEANAQFDAFSKQAISALTSVAPTAAVQLAQVVFAQAENALKLNYFGSASEFLSRLEMAARDAGVALAFPVTLRESLSTAAKLQSENNKAQDKMKRLDQEVKQMQAGYDAVFGKKV